MGLFDKIKDRLDKNALTKEELKAAEQLRLEYGISNDEYVSEQYAALPLEEQIEKANDTRIARNQLDAIISGTDWDETTAIQTMEEACDKYEITKEQYVSYKLYLYDEARQGREVARKKRTQIKAEEYIQRVADKHQVTVEEVRERLKIAENKYGISARYFYKFDYYGETEIAMARDYLKQERKISKENSIYADIRALTGMKKKDVNEQLAIIAEHRGRKFPLREYFRRGLYEYDAATEYEKIDVILKHLDEERALRMSIRNKLALVDRGEMAYADIEGDLELFREIEGGLMSELWQNQLYDVVKYSIPELEEDLNKREEVLVDMAVTLRLLDFFPVEYVCFNFYEKDIPTRRTFVSEVLRKKVLTEINSQESIDILNSKYSAYEILKPYYHREAALIEGDMGYTNFVDFCSRHKSFIKKDNFDSMGRGIKKVKIKKKTILRNLYDSLTDGGKTILLEELIDAHEKISFLNPDSVNTVRVVVYLDESGTQVLDCFMKVGRAGSYVDNGGAGGILVHVNQETGTFDSTGIDEKGFRYTTHPDHGYEFIGYQLPEWDKVLELAQEAIYKVPGLRFVGWDFTYNADNQWVIVEGNSTTQYIGQQATIDTGIIDKFKATVNYDELMMLESDEE